MPQAHAHFPLFPNYGYPEHATFPFAVQKAEGSWLYSENSEKIPGLFCRNCGQQFGAPAPQNPGGD